MSVHPTIDLLLAAPRLSTAIPWIFGLIAAVLAAGTAWAQHRRRQRKEESLYQLLRRAPGWRRTEQPCGLGVDNLAGQTIATPRGDRRYGLRYAITGPLSLRIAGQDVACECGFFQWWYEQRRSSGGQHGGQRRYVEQREVVAIVALPSVVTRPVRIRPESLLGRFGITRGGDQLESSEFNRRFRVDGTDRALTVQLLDANLQHHLLERLQGRSVELSFGLLVLGGSPAHRDVSLEGVVGAYPVVRDDLEALVATIPDQFWRALEADRSGPPDATPGQDGSEVDRWRS